MMVRLLVFARFRDVLGTDYLNISIPAPCNVSTLKGQLAREYPNSVNLLSKSAIAINGELADADAPIRSDDEVALIPPVSGGQR